LPPDLDRDREPLGGRHLPRGHDGNHRTGGPSLQQRLGSGADHHRCWHEPGWLGTGRCPTQHPAAPKRHRLPLRVATRRQPARPPPWHPSQGGPDKKFKHILENHADHLVARIEEQPATIGHGRSRRRRHLGPPVVVRGQLLLSVTVVSTGNRTPRGGGVYGVAKLVSLGPGWRHGGWPAGRCLAWPARYRPPAYR
jgi:hypothetical protein